MNIRKADHGWVSNVYCRRQTNPELVEVIDRCPKAIEEYPDNTFWRDPYGKMNLIGDGRPARGEVLQGGAYTLYTRIYMGITPPQGYEPGYVCVVGEEWDRTYEAKERRLFVIDEAACFPDVDPTQALIPDLLRATAALKDIYLPANERESNVTALGGDRRLIVNTKSDLFLSELRKIKWGITGYPEESDIGDGDIRKRHPFFVSRERIAPLYEPPLAEDEDYAMKTTRAMLARFTDEDVPRPMLGHHACVEILVTTQHSTPLRAVGNCILAFQVYDWTEALEGRGEEYDGYSEEEISPQMESAMNRIKMRRLDFVSGLLHMASDNRDRSLLLRKGIREYRNIVGCPEPLIPGDIK